MPDPNPDQNDNCDPFQFQYVMDRVETKFLFSRKLLEKMDETFR